MNKKIFLLTMKKYDYVMFDTNGRIDDDGVKRFLELVEREAVEHTLAPDVCPACEGTGIDPNDNDLYCQPCGGMGRRNAGKA